VALSLYNGTISIACLGEPAHRISQSLS